MSNNLEYIRYDAHHSIQALVFEPLFEEYNRTRRLLAEVARGLDAAGVGVNFASLPGIGESLIEIEDVRLEDWHNAARAAFELHSPQLIISLRGGALIDNCGPAKGWWRLAPETGSRISRDLKRTQIAGETGLYAGHRLSETFLTELGACVPSAVTPLRTMRLESDAAEADIKVAASPLWRRAEPGEDADLAAAMTSDIADWACKCVVS